MLFWCGLQPPNLRSIDLRYSYVSTLLHRHFRGQIFTKNDEKMKFPESVQGHPRVSSGCQGGFKTPQRSILRCPGTQKMMKLEKLKISIQTERLGYYMSRGGSDFSFFLFLFHVKWLEEHISPMLPRVIRGQGGASSRFKKIETSWLDFAEPKNDANWGKVNRSHGGCHSFSPLEHVVLMRISILHTFAQSFGASFIKIRWMDAENEPLQNLSFSSHPAARSSPPLPPPRAPLPWCVDQGNPDQGCTRPPLPRPPAPRRIYMLYIYIYIYIYIYVCMCIHIHIFICIIIEFLWRLWLSVKIWPFVWTSNNFPCVFCITWVRTEHSKPQICALAWRRRHSKFWKYALRVLPAVTRLTVYRRLRVCLHFFMKIWKCDFLMKIRKSGRHFEWIKEYNWNTSYRKQQELSNALIKSENSFHFCFQKYVDIFSWKSENSKFWWNPEIQKIYWMNQGMHFKHLGICSTSSRAVTRLTVYRASRIPDWLVEQICLEELFPHAKPCALGFRIIFGEAYRWLWCRKN